MDAWTIKQHTQNKNKKRRNETTRMTMKIPSKRLPSQFPYCSNAIVPCPAARFLVLGSRHAAFKQVALWSFVFFRSGHAHARRCHGHPLAACGRCTAGGTRLHFGDLGNDTASYTHSLTPAIHSPIIIAPEPIWSTRHLLKRSLLDASLTHLPPAPAAAAAHLRYLYVHPF